MIVESRTEKYASIQTVPGSRANRNEQLYKDINKTEYESIEVKSNATVLGDNRRNIDVDKIKSILDTHYHSAPKRKTIAIEQEPEETPNPIFETKEYDINVVIDRAKDQKRNDYEEDKYRKLSETQFDILKDLDVEEEPLDDRVITQKSSLELESLINTININEKEIEKARVEAEEAKPKEEDEPKEEPEKLEETTEEEDLFASLLGDEETQIIEAPKSELDEDIANLKTEGVKLESDIAEEISKDDKEEQKETPKHKATKKTEESLESSFFTKSNAIKKRDFEDFQDLSEEESSNKFVKIFIVILLIIFIVGIIILIKSFI